jgi:hypothetical protein
MSTNTATLALLVYPTRWRVIEFCDSRRCMHWCRQDVSFISISSPTVAIWRDMVDAWYCHTDVWSMFHITRVAKTRAFLADSRKSLSWSHELHIGTILHLSSIRRSHRSLSLHSRRNLPDDDGRLLECSTYQTPAWSSAQQGEYYSPSYVLYSEHKLDLHLVIVEVQIIITCYIHRLVNTTYRSNQCTGAWHGTVSIQETAHHSHIKIQNHNYSQIYFHSQTLIKTIRHLWTLATIYTWTGHKLHSLQWMYWLACPIHSILIQVSQIIQDSFRFSVRIVSEDSSTG